MAESDPELSPAYDWRATAGGGRKHVVNTASKHVAALCGVSVWTFDRWYGTGSQKEYEKLEQLDPCKSCLKKAPAR